MASDQDSNYHRQDVMYLMKMQSDSCTLSCPSVGSKGLVCPASPGWYIDWSVVRQW